MTEVRENHSKPFSFPKKERLKRREDIQSVFRRGASTSCFGAKLFFLRGNGAERRIAFTFARKFGGAVERNRARRLGREAYRHLRSEIKGGYDMVLLVYPFKDDFQAANSLDIDLAGGNLPPGGLPLRIRQMETLFNRAGLLAAKRDL
jgi:ribonuclease P protein component